MFKITLSWYRERMIETLTFRWKTIYEKFGLTLWGQFLERNRNSSSVTKGRDEKHIFWSSSKWKPARVFFGLFRTCFPRFFFSPLFSLFNLRPLVILHHYSSMSWTWRRFQMCIWSFSSNLSYKPNKPTRKMWASRWLGRPVASHHLRMGRKQRGSRVGSPSLPSLLFLLHPMSPRASPTYFLR